MITKNRSADEIHLATHKSLFQGDSLREYGQLDCEFCHKHKPVTRYEARHWDGDYYYCKECVEKLNEKV